ncbi:dentin sialophosphoprotein-like [Sycon ciliatum]|uniref:dentin sialophosphoprotein-like n=1 Tax=Sycon ciliatum TaxID=27933 RepID=UPI0031F6FF8F
MKSFVVLALLGCLCALVINVSSRSVGKNILARSDSDDSSDSVAMDTGMGESDSSDGGDDSSDDSDDSNNEDGSDSEDSENGSNSDDSDSDDGSAVQAQQPAVIVPAVPETPRPPIFITLPVDLDKDAPQTNAPTEAAPLDKDAPQ